MRSKFPKPVEISSDGPNVFRMKLSELENAMGKEQAKAFLQDQNIAIDHEGCVTAIAYVQDKNGRYDTYINSNDPIDPNISQQDFLQYYAIIVPVGDLTEWWMTIGYVHTSISALSHNAEDLFLHWNDKKMREGVIKFSTHARNFNKGIMYPNIGLDGLRDLAHVRYVVPHHNLPHSNSWPAARQGRKEYFPPLAIHEGFAEFTKSVAETIILAVHTAICKKFPEEIVAPCILKGLCFILREWHRDCTKFEDAWKRLDGNRILNDVKTALYSDDLEMRRFVALAEKYVLATENWL